MPTDLLRHDFAEALAGYPTAEDARDPLTHASRIAAKLAVVLDTTHQTLDNTVENIRNQP